MKIGIISVGHHGGHRFTSIADVSYMVWVYYPSGQSRSFDFKNEGEASVFVGKTLKRRKDVNIVVYTPCVIEDHVYGAGFPPIKSVRYVDLAFVQNFNRYPSSFITTKTK